MATKKQLEAQVKKLQQQVSERDTLPGEVLEKYVNARERAQRCEAQLAEADAEVRRILAEMREWSAK